MKRLSFLVSAALALQASATVAAGVPALAGHAPHQVLAASPLSGVALATLPSLSSSAGAGLPGLTPMGSLATPPAALPGLPPVRGVLDWVYYDVEQYPNDVQAWVGANEGWVGGALSDAESDAGRIVGDARCSGGATRQCGVGHIPADVIHLVSHVVQNGQGSGVPIIVNPPRPHDGL